MNPNTKTYCWSAVAGLATYALALVVMERELHPAAVGQVMAVISLPLFPAMMASAFVNRKLMKPPAKKYFWRFSAGMGAYVLGIDLANRIHTPSAPCKYLLVLLPVLPLVFVCNVIIRHVAEGLDELQRKVVTEAFAFSGLATGFTCFSYLFVRDLGAPVFHAEWAFYLMWIYYGIGLFLANRRYR